jgi:hypothetical protein
MGGTGGATGSSGTGGAIGSGGTGGATGSGGTGGATGDAGAVLTIYYTVANDVYRMVPGAGNDVSITSDFDRTPGSIAAGGGTI